ncbi:bifunctional methylenetetrahydrofolate dehydrogenase/methenyltetrahydrofolate cyclohydrolase FolD [bacterium]|nr:bifunctional methylenetetrahydrofolate dehydrogenase/methenyltetrahydrofolate cyclohydrolase FolD [bacterium]
MSAIIIDGKAIANTVCQRVEKQVKEFKQQIGREPGLAVIQVGEDPASQIYVCNKRVRCRELGILSFALDLPANTTEADLLALVEKLNCDPQVDGILVQLPLPKQISADKIIRAIDPGKDVDGFHPYNMGSLFIGNPRLVPCTPLGIMELIYSTGVDIKGKKAVIVGRSNIVGKPITMLLLQEHATVTLCHSRTQDLAAECRTADILVVAVGQKFCVPGDWIKPQAIVIDVGMNRDESGLCGDVAFQQAKERAAFITPVPGGVGPTTIAMLMSNTLKAAQLREGRKQA